MEGSVVWLCFWPPHLSWQLLLSAMLLLLLLLLLEGVACVEKLEDEERAREDINALLLIYQQADALCPCVTRHACPDYFGSSPLDVKNFGNLPPCLLYNRVRCCKRVAGGGGGAAGSEPTSGAFGSTAGSGGSFEGGTSGSGGSFDSGTAGSGDSLEGGTAGSGGSLEGGTAGSGGTFDSGTAGSGGSPEGGTAVSGGTFDSGTAGSGGSPEGETAGSGGTFDSGTSGSGGSLGSGASVSGGSLGSGASVSGGSFGTGSGGSLGSGASVSGGSYGTGSGGSLGSGGSSGTGSGGSFGSGISVSGGSLGSGTTVSGGSFGSGTTVSGGSFGSGTTVSGGSFGSGTSGSGGSFGSGTSGSGGSFGSGTSGSGGSFGSGTTVSGGSFESGTSGSGGSFGSGASGSGGSFGSGTSGAGGGMNAGVSHSHPPIELGYLPPLPDPSAATSTPALLQHLRPPQQHHSFQVTPSSSQHVRVLTRVAGQHGRETKPLRYGQKLPTSRDERPSLRRQLPSPVPSDRLPAPPTPAHHSAPFTPDRDSATLTSTQTPPISTQDSTSSTFTEDSVPPTTADSVTQSHFTQGFDSPFRKGVSTAPPGPSDPPRLSLLSGSLSHHTPQLSTASPSDSSHSLLTPDSHSPSHRLSSPSPSHSEDTYTLILKVFPSSSSTDTDRLVSSAAPILASVKPLAAAPNASVPSVVEPLVHLAQLPLSDGVGREDMIVADLPCVAVTQCFRHYGNRSLDECVYGVQLECEEREVRCLDQYQGPLNLRCFRAIPPEALLEIESLVPLYSVLSPENMIPPVNMEGGRTEVRPSGSGAPSQSLKVIIPCVNITACERRYGSVTDTRKYGILSLCPKDHIRCLDRIEVSQTKNFIDFESSAFSSQLPEQDDDASEHPTDEHLDSPYQSASEHLEVTYAAPPQQIYLRPVNERHTERAISLPQHAAQASRHVQAHSYPQQNQTLQHEIQKQQSHIHRQEVQQEASSQKPHQNPSQTPELAERVIQPRPSQGHYTFVPPIYNPNVWQNHASSLSSSKTWSRETGRPYSQAINNWSVHQSYPQRAPWPSQRRAPPPQSLHGRWGSPLQHSGANTSFRSHS